MNIPKEKSIESGISSDGDDSKFRTGGNNMKTVLVFGTVRRPYPDRQFMST